MSILAKARTWARNLKHDTVAVYCAARDTRTPLLLRGLALAIAAYALSPIDLIPDFIPVLGYLDDLLIVPLGLWLVIRLLPPEVLIAARIQAAAMLERPTSYNAAIVIVGLWLLCIAGLTYWWLNQPPLMQDGYLGAQKPGYNNEQHYSGQFHRRINKLFFVAIVKRRPCARTCFVSACQTTRSFEYSLLPLHNSGPRAA